MPVSGKLFIGAGQGPYPTTSDERSTSVSTLSIERFLCPVCCRDLPDDLLRARMRRRAHIASTA